MGGRAQKVQPYPKRTPTVGSLMAILGSAGVPYGKWLRFALPLYGVLFGLGLVAVVVAVAIGLR